MSTESPGRSQKKIILGMAYLFPVDAVVIVNVDHDVQQAGIDDYNVFVSIFIRVTHANFGNSHGGVEIERRFGQDGLTKKAANSFGRIMAANLSALQQYIVEEYDRGEVSDDRIRAFLKEHYKKAHVRKPRAKAAVASKKKK